MRHSLGGRLVFVVSAIVLVAALVTLERSHGVPFLEPQAPS
jgi:hypothetical protein